MLRVQLHATRHFAHCPVCTRQLPPCITRHLTLPGRYPPVPTGDTLSHSTQSAPARLWVPRAAILHVTQYPVGTRQVLFCCFVRTRHFARYPVSTRHSTRATSHIYNISNSTRSVNTGTPTTVCRHARQSRTVPANAHKAVCRYHFTQPAACSDLPGQYPVRCSFAHDSATRFAALQYPPMHGQQAKGLTSRSTAFHTVPGRYPPDAALQDTASNTLPGQYPPVPT